MNVFVTQRMDKFPPHNERRDSIDICWHSIFFEIGITPILIPNNLNLVSSMVKKNVANGLILTGGNTIGGLEGADAPERDEVENFLLDFCIKEEIPVVGFCRGFQFIHKYFGGELTKVEGYAARQHDLLTQGKITRRITTHCNYCISKTSMDIISIDENKMIMSASALEGRVYGQMWHPERAINKSEEDILKIKEVLKGAK